MKASDATAPRADMPAGHAQDMDHTYAWPSLYSRIGADIAGPLTMALERVQMLAQTGQIARSSLRALGHEIEEARHAAMIAQQLARFATGRVRQSHERIDLAKLFNDLIAQRAREAQERAVPLRQTLKPAEVILDPTLLHNLLNSLLDWALVHAQSEVQVAVDHKVWPPNARVHCKFVYQPSDRSPDPNAVLHATRLDSLHWHLVLHTALALGLPLERHDTASHTTVTLEFPRTVNEEMSGVSTLELDPAFGPSLNSKPLAGSHVLVVAARRELRTQVRDAIRHMGLLVDYVSSVDEAREFCRGGLPHAVVYDSAIGGDRFDQLQAELARQAGDLVFVQIAEDSDMYEVSGFNGSPIARVGRRAVATGLPAALLFELSKSL